MVPYHILNPTVGNSNNSKIGELQADFVKKKLEVKPFKPQKLAFEAWNQALEERLESKTLFFLLLFFTYIVVSAKQFYLTDFNGLMRRLFCMNLVHFEEGHI